MAKPHCICGCGQRSVHRHHVIYRQHVEQHGGSLKDERNLVPVAFDCHGAHHSGAKRLLVSMLPDPVFEFAGEVLGEAAAGYLARYYRGSDPRLALLS